MSGNRTPDDGNANNIIAGGERDGKNRALWSSMMSMMLIHKR